jgi:uncharacterized protein (TIGR02284 family)
MGSTSENFNSLYHLVEICRQGQVGFELAAKAISNPLLRAELIQYSAQRSDFESDLRNQIELLGQSPRNGGSGLTAVHHGWTNLKAAIATKDNHAILVECERGESAAIQTYREAMQCDLPKPVAMLIGSQFEEIHRIHDRIVLLGDMFKQS